MGDEGEGSGCYRPCTRNRDCARDELCGSVSEDGESMGCALAPSMKNVGELDGGGYD